jgi:hypothetical protein
MIVLHPNQNQYLELNGYKYKSSQLIFVKDGSNKWIVGLEVLNDINFIEIYDKLNQLERITYTPPINEEDY